VREKRKKQKQTASRFSIEFCAFKRKGNSGGDQFWRPPRRPGNRFPSAQAGTQSPYVARRQIFSFRRQLHLRFGQLGVFPWVASLGQIGFWEGGLVARGKKKNKTKKGGGAPKGQRGHAGGTRRRKIGPQGGPFSEGLTLGELICFRNQFKPGAAQRFRILRGRPQSHGGPGQGRGYLDRGRQKTGARRLEGRAPEKARKLAVRLKISCRFLLIKVLGGFMQNKKGVHLDFQTPRVCQTRSLGKISGERSHRKIGYLALIGLVGGVPTYLGRRMRRLGGRFCAGEQRYTAIHGPAWGRGGTKTTFSRATRRGGGGNYCQPQWRAGGLIASRGGKRPLVF